MTTAARVLFLTLAVVGVTATVPIWASLTCAALMLALIPHTQPRKAKP